MVLEALQAGERRRGTSVAAIKVYILQKYPTVDALRLNHLLKQALATGLHRGLLIRPVNSKAKGATGSFKVSAGWWRGRWEVPGGPGVWCGELGTRLELQLQLFLPELWVLFPLSSCLFFFLCLHPDAPCPPSPSPQGG